MKLSLKNFLFTAVFPLVLFASNAFAVKAMIPVADNIECDEAFVLNCQNQSTFSSNFSEGGVAVLDPLSCLQSNQTAPLREFWFEIELNGALSYFLDGNGVNAGFEVYAGACKNLELVSCHPAIGNNTYISFYAPEESQYFIRVLGYDYNGGSNMQISLNCFNPQPPCNLTIDQIQIAPCINSEGMIDVDLSGIVHGNAYLDFVSCEILTDAGLFFFDGTRHDSTWNVDAEISGTEIEYINVICGSSENYCSDVLNNITLPVSPCNTPDESSLVGSLMWNANCVPHLGKVGFYQPGTTQLIMLYDVIIQNNGHFTIVNPIQGEFDILVKVDGCLPKGFEDVEIANGVSNSLVCGSLYQGEVSGDSAVNLADVSAINTRFNQVIPIDSPISFFDLNCDGIVNVVDVSVINYSFGMVGDIVPLD